MRTRFQGFTLIELMIVVAVIAIIAAIAYPSYIDSVRKTRLGQAKEAAMQAASGLERKASQANQYESSLDGLKTYEDQLSYSYARTSSNRGYTLEVIEKTERFKIWVGINSLGTKCACSGTGCADPGDDFVADTASCPTGLTAF